MNPQLIKQFPRKNSLSPYKVGYEEKSAISLVQELKALRQDIIETTDKELDKIDTAVEEAKKLAQDTNKALQEIKKFSSKIESEFESVTTELVDILKEIKSQGLKGDDGYTPVKGVDYFDGKTPTIDVEEIAEIASSKVKTTPASLKIIAQNIEGEDIVPKLNKAANLQDLSLTMANIKDWDKKWNDVKTEISRNKGGHHGGGFNNIANASGTISTGLNTLKFTGATVTQTGRTVTVAIGSGAFSTVTVTPTPDDTTLVYTASSAITAVVVNGSIYVDGTTGMGGIISIVGTTITLPSPIGTGGSIFGIA